MTRLSSLFAAESEAESPAVPADRRERLLDILGYLDGVGYDFIAPTPSTHARVVARAERRMARNLVDALGWSLPVPRGTLDPMLERILGEAGLFAASGESGLHPSLRVSRVEGALFWHSAYPTDAADSVFLGPDSCRFAQFIAGHMPADVATILDYGAGAGVGGIIAAQRAPGALLTIADVNPKALFLASINAEHAAVRHELLHVSSPTEVPGSYDLIVTHPPFMIDTAHRAYRDGGGLHGGQLSLDWSLAGADLLAPGGRFVMHTGAAIVGGTDVLHAALAERLDRTRFSFSYRELDPDIFGDELDKPAYADVERIAAVGVVIDRVGA
ncbi:hypothetical protein GGC65_001361 [Sphingopyxis sp. OAS728]|uniref:methyltransferase n=1 Tax=Sphingopyxis sp. OAS728 TaxID=2663823 RepID=UPI001789BC4E|nr:methyltransferase [Sphingopyxis sp. OAS728]MBE1526905.1 hypothetical protein [Sphingopyxis sp. OAS728]